MTSGLSIVHRRNILCNSRTSDGASSLKRHAGEITVVLSSGEINSTTDLVRFRGHTIAELEYNCSSEFLYSLQSSIWRQPTHNVNALTFCTVNEHVKTVEDWEGPDEHGARETHLSSAPHPPDTVKSV